MAFDPITAALDIGGRIIDKLFPDKTKADEAKARLVEAAQAGEFNLAIKQIEVNVEEAKHQLWWVAGWRPAVGWICGLSLFYHYIGEPFMYFFANLFNYNINPPAIDTSELMTLLLGILGLGAYRSYDNKQQTNGGPKKP